MSPVPRLRRDQQVDLLRGVSLFSGCSRTELSRIARITTEHTVPAGRVLTRQGDPGEEFFVIIEGEAEATSGDVQLATLKPTAFFGELALLDGGERTATVVAKTDMRLLVLSRQEFYNDHFLVGSVARQMMKELGSRLRRADALATSTQRSARDRAAEAWTL